MSDPVGSLRVANGCLPCRTAPCVQTSLFDDRSWHSEVHGNKLTVRPTACVQAETPTTLIQHYGNETYITNSYYMEAEWISHIILTCSASLIRYRSVCVFGRRKRFDIQAKLIRRWTPLPSSSSSYHPPIGICFLLLLLSPSSSLLLHLLRSPSSLYFSSCHPPPHPPPPLIFLVLHLPYILHPHLSRLPRFFVFDLFPLM